MYIECRHVQPSGQKCKSPAVRNNQFCYFHRNLRERIDAPPPRQGTAFILPNIEDFPGILLAVTETLRAMGESRIKRSEAGTYLYGITIAARVIAHIEKNPCDPVRALEYDNNCSELGEQKNACEPLQDCLNCDRQDICEAYRTAQKNQPKDYNAMMARARSMTTEQVLAEWDVKQKAEAARMRRLRSLAVRDDGKEEDPTYNSWEAPQPSPQAQSGLQASQPSPQAQPLLLAQPNKETAPQEDSPLIPTIQAVADNSLPTPDTPAPAAGCPILAVSCKGGITKPPTRPTLARVIYE